MPSTRILVLAPLAVAALCLSGCSSGKNGDGDVRVAPVKKITLADPARRMEVDDPGVTVFSEKGVGPTTLAQVDWPAGVDFVQIGMTCSPRQKSSTTDDEDEGFTVKWGKTGYGSGCGPDGIGATATVPVTHVGARHTFSVKIAPGVSWWIAGVAVPDPDA